MANFMGKKIPLNVMLSVTNRCTSRCRYCGIPARTQKELNSDQIRSLIDQITEMGCQRLGLWGGEPLVREDIGEIIDHAKDRGLFVTMDSNGHLLPEKMRAIKRLDHIILALDGDEYSHDLNRGEGSFRKVMSAIEAVSGKIPLWTVTVLTKNNLNSIDSILDQAKKFKFLSTFQLLHHNDRLSRNHSELFATQEAYRNTIQQLILEKKNGAPIASSSTYLNYLLEWPDFFQPVSPKRIKSLRCLAGKMYCNVDTNGAVYPCSLLVEKTKALNFVEVGFKKAFESLRSHPCQGCMASCFVEYNNLFSLNPAVIFEWIKSFCRTKESLCKKTG